MAVVGPWVEAFTIKWDDSSLSKTCCNIDSRCNVWAWIFTRIFNHPCLSKIYSTHNSIHLTFNSVVFTPFFSVLLNPFFVFNTLKLQQIRLSFVLLSKRLLPLSRFFSLIFLLVSWGSLSLSCDSFSGSHRLAQQKMRLFTQAQSLNKSTQRRVLTMCTCFFILRIPVILQSWVSRTFLDLFFPTMLKQRCCWTSSLGNKPTPSGSVW
jgi:hypothetical protein